VAVRSDHPSLYQAVEQFGDPIGRVGKDFLLVVAGDDNTQRWWQEIVHLEDAPSKNMIGGYEIGITARTFKST
jgi:hypothetical protein